MSPIRIYEQMLDFAGFYQYFSVLDVVTKQIVLLDTY